MTRITLLTDGCFEQCRDIVGSIVHGEAFKKRGEIVGYDVSPKELNRVGATFKLSEWEDDATLFFSAEHNEVEELQDEYR